MREPKSFSLWRIVGALMAVLLSLTACTGGLLLYRDLRARSALRAEAESYRLLSDSVRTVAGARLDYWFTSGLMAQDTFVEQRQKRLELRWPTCDYYIAPSTPDSGVVVLNGTTLAKCQYSKARKLCAAVAEAQKRVSALSVGGKVDVQAKLSDLDKATQALSTAISTVLRVQKTRPGSAIEGAYETQDQAERKVEISFSNLADAIEACKPKEGQHVLTLGRWLLSADEQDGYYGPSIVDDDTLTSIPNAPFAPFIVKRS